MKRILFILLMMLIITVPIEAKDWGIEGSLQNIITDLNGYGELLMYLGYGTQARINIDKCSFEILNDTTGLYTCPVNPATALGVYTDKFGKPKALKIYGKAVNERAPKETTFDWAFAALLLYLPSDTYYQESFDFYLVILESGHMENENMNIECGIEPNYPDTWYFLMINK